ncbi:MAG: FmdB family zinc ribbon protein [Chloroflexota bacterium]
MPIYEYKCDTCGKVFEVKQSFSEEPLTQCPNSACESAARGEASVHRIISKNVGLIFNGSGFYQTDYGNKHASMSSPQKSAPACNCPNANSCDVKPAS